MSEEWSFKEIVEPVTGKTRRHYFYRRKPCKRILLDSHLAKQLAGYVLIEKDLRSAGIWLAEIDEIRGSDGGGRNVHAKDRERYNLVKGLFVAALTFYGKAFSQCEGRRAQLNRRQLDQSFLEAHDEAISYRNNFAAHSGAKLLEKAEIALVLPPKTKRDKEPMIYREMTQPDYIESAQGEKSFSELIEHVRLIPLKKIDELSEKIFQEEVLPRGYEYWSKK